ncbi:MAG: sodium:proton antiporter [Devosia sp.]|nr:sodium:proton antiporter [Devosia sp.]
MHHDTPLITTIVAGLVLAYIFGMIANRLRMPPLVGYLFAGILVGPNTPGFVADQALGAELAELGVILLMFGVGLHFSLKDLMSVRALAIPGALVQIAFATLLGLGLAMLLGWGLGAGLLFGLALSVASTVVLLKALQDRRLIETERGRIAVGWLIVEDLAMVLALVLIPAIASLNGTDTGIHDPFVSFVERIVGGSVGIWGVLALTVVKLAAFVGFMLIVGRRVIPWALHGTAHTGSRELFRLAVLAIALGVALGSSVLFGVSLALGAFFAGMILSESELSHRAAQETLPLRDAFAVLFFVSVGMLFDPSIIITNPLPVLAAVFIIVVGKSLAAFAIVLLFKRPVGTALTISASLAQIGEFSFILASMGVSLAILPPEGQDLILAGALISIVLNPVVFFALDLLKPRFEAKAALRRGEMPVADGVRIEPGEISAAAKGPITTDAPGEAAIDSGAHGADEDDVDTPTMLTDHTVLVGYGQVGRVVADGLKAQGTPLLVIEDSDHDVRAAREAGLDVLFGNAASSRVLKLANLTQARSLMVAISNGFEAGSVCESGRKLNPSIRIITRAYSEEEDTYLRGLGADIVIRGEREIGMGMLAYARGERSDETAEVVAPVDVKLPQGENLLEKVAPVPVAEVVTVPTAVAVSDALVAEPEAVAVFEAVAVVEAEPVAGPAPEAVVAEEPASELVMAEEPVEPAVEVAADPAVIEAVESTAAPETVIILPPPEAAVEEAAGLDSVVATPTVGEAPAEIEEVVVTPVVAQPVETESESETETEEQEEAEVNEGSVAPLDELEVEPAADAKRVVPLVVPEPKI